jgi:hypothetical protein
MIYNLIIENKEEGKHAWLRKIYKHKNLATKEFQQIWLEWWKGAVPPRTEVDIILIFEDPIELIDKGLICCVEVEYFSKKDIGKKNFYEGLQQTLAFAVFGFDGLALWHIFSQEVMDEVIGNFSGTVKELINGFKLPVFYLATKILDEEELKLKCFEPWQVEGSVDYFIDCLNRHWISRESRNPLLEDKKIKDRRNVVKTIFKIPV